MWVVEVVLRLMSTVRKISPSWPGTLVTFEILHLPSLSPTGISQ